MPRLAILPDKSVDHAIRDSLNTIKEVHVQLRLLTGSCATPALLTSQIDLYNVLLDEISGIHISLARDLRYARLPPIVSDRAVLSA